MILERLITFNLAIGIVLGFVKLSESSKSKIQKENKVFKEKTSKLIKKHQRKF